MDKQQQAGLGHASKSLVLLTALIFSFHSLVEAAPAKGGALSDSPKQYRKYKKSSVRKNYRSNRVRPTKAAPATTTTQTPVKTPVTPAESVQAQASAPVVASGTPIKSQLESFSKKVDVRRGGSEGWGKAQSKMNLLPSDQIRTGHQSVARLKLEDGTKVLLLQNSEAEMENLNSVQKTIKLLRGRVRAVVKKMQGGNNFKIKTPIGVASVRGTDFEVAMSEAGDQMTIDVHEGQVGVSRLGDLADEVVVNPGERLQFGMEGELGNPQQTGASPLNKAEIKAEVMNTEARDSILAMAAEETKNADYQVGKSLIDVTGRRVRTEEYITRPAANQYKLVVLNERATRFDYYTYLGTFNQTLPEDLSVALGQIGGKLGATAPDYYLTAYETKMSNTIDYLADSASGGHLVQIDFDGTTYTLTDSEDGTNTRQIDAVEDLGNGTYKIYNPLRDSFSLTSAANLSEAQKVAVVDEGKYREFASGDTYWKGRFNDYSLYANTTLKTAYTKKGAVNNTLAIDFDADFANAPLTAIAESPSGAANLHQRLSLYYSDGSKLVYDNYIIDDDGTIMTNADVTGGSSSSTYKDGLEKLNFEMRVSATEFGGRTIDLVIDPRIATQTGLFQ